MISSILHALSLLGLNAVPALGWLIGDWTSGTTLAIYWFENVAATVYIAGRIVLQQRWKPMRGHFCYRGRQGAKRGAEGSFVRNFLMVSLVFSAAHGFFLAIIVFLLTHNDKADLVAIDWRTVGLGCLFVVLFLTVDFLLDVPRLKSWTFANLERHVDRNLARVIVVHLALIIGMAVVAFTDATRGFFIVFVVLKTMNDLAFILPQWEPDKPPAWLSKLMNKVPNTQRGKGHKDETFEEFWTKDRAAEVARRKYNETPMTAPTVKVQR